MKLLVTFGSIGDAFRCEKCLAASRYRCEIIPEPRHLGVACNYAVAVELPPQGTESAEDADGVNAVLEVLAQGGIKYVRLVPEK